MGIMIRHAGRFWLLLLAAAMLSLVPRAALAQQFPRLTGRVVDAANVLPPDAEARLTVRLEALEKQSRRQLVVATIPDLQGYDISDYGYRLGRHWGIGGKDKNDGALLIVAPKQRQLRIEVGYGLEGVLTDGLSSLIINQTIVPRFKQGDMAGGIEAGTDAIVRQLTLPDEEARKLAAEAETKAQQPGFDPGLIVFLLIFLLFFVLPLLRGGRGRRHAGGIVPVILWDAFNHSSRGSGGFGGGFGGGGFSGGGGSFGGGGASGRW